MEQSLEISSDNPLCVIFLIERPEAVASLYAHSVAAVVHRLINACILKGSRGDKITDSFQIGVIG